MRMSRQRVLALLVLTCILLITLDARGSAMIGKARNKFGDWLSPLRGVGRAISVPVQNAWNGITNYDELQRENDRLRELVQLQQGDAIAGEAAIQTARELEAQAEIESLRDLSNVTAKVLTYGASNNRLTVEINKGSDDLIRVGMPVVNAGGLVGKVTQVSATRSIVLLITDPTYSVPVTISGSLALQPTTSTTTTLTPGQTTPPGSDGALDPTIDPNADPNLDPSAGAGELAALPEDPTTAGALGGDVIPVTGNADELAAVDPTAVDPVTGSVPESVPTTTIVPTTTTVFDLSKLRPRETGGLEGRGPGKTPVVRFVANDRKGRQIQVGDVVVTNGGTDASGQLQSLAPADLVVGRVKSIVERPGGAGPEIEVEPAADLERLQFVRVIRYVPSSEVGG